MSDKSNARTIISDSMRYDTVIRSIMICLRPRNRPVLTVQIHPGQWVVQSGIEGIWEICELRQDYWAHVMSGNFCRFVPFFISLIPFLNQCVGETERIFCSANISIKYSILDRAYITEIRISMQTWALDIFCRAKFSYGPRPDTDHEFIFLFRRLFYDLF
jgi:hypothetical protein